MANVPRLCTAACIIVIAWSCHGGERRTAAGRPTWDATKADTILPVLPPSSPQFRAAGVYYWQGNWNYNFWSNLKPARLDTDFGRIRKLNFNTVLVSVPWGVFQLRAFPPRYSDAAFEKLQTFLAKAAEHDLRVALRVGTPEHIPGGIEGGNYDVPYLFVDDREFGAYCDLFRETARRLDRFKNLWFLFSSWEDMFGYSQAAAGSDTERLSYMRRALPYAAHLQKRPLAEWNARWGTNFRSYDDVPFPSYGTLAYRDFLQWADDRLLQVILPGIAHCVKRGSARVKVSHEVRIDAEPIWPQGRDHPIEWFDHMRTWNLVPEDDLITTYFNPYWGAPNQGDFITATRAVANLEHLLSLLQQHTDGRPIFFDQFNFTDATPYFSWLSRLHGEDEIARFLGLALGELHRNSVGYAVWSFTAYEANVLFNSSFESGFDRWTATAVPGGPEPRILFDADRQEHFARLPPGASIQQTVQALWSPGVHDPRTRFTMRLTTRSGPGGMVTAEIEAPRGDGWALRYQKRITGEPAWTEFETNLDFRATLRLTLRSTGSAPIDVDDLTLFNHVQDAAVYGPRGESLGQRDAVLGHINAEWAKGRSPQLERFATSLDSAALGRLPSMHEDGWVETEARLPLHVPAGGGTLRLDLKFPKVFDSAGNRCELLLGNRSLGVYLVPAGGPTTLRIPLQGYVSASGNYWVVVRPLRTFRATDVDPSSRDQRSLGLILLRAEVDSAAADATVSSRPRRGT